MVQSKGSTYDWIVERIVKDLNILGWGKLVLRCDQEPSIVDLQNAVISLRKSITNPDINTIPENSPKYEHQSNGAAERGVQEVKGIARTIKHYLESMLTFKLNFEHPIIAWMIEHIGTIINRHLIGDDGRTAYERIKVRATHQPLLPFADAVLYRIPQELHQAPSLEPRWGDGVFLGINGRTGEYIIGTATGAIATRTIKRRPDNEKWKAELIEQVNYYPWDPKPKAGQAKPPIKLEDRVPIEDMPTRVATPVPQARRVYIRMTSTSTASHQGAQDAKQYKMEMQGPPATMSTAEGESRKRCRKVSKVDGELNKQQAGSGHVTTRRSN